MKPVRDDLTLSDHTHEGYFLGRVSTLGRDPVTAVTAVAASGKEVRFRTVEPAIPFLKPSELIFFVEVSFHIEQEFRCHGVVTLAFSIQNPCRFRHVKGTERENVQQSFIIE